MSIKAIDLLEVVDFTSKFDKDAPKTIWKIGTLDTRIRKMIEDIAWEYEADPTQPGTAKARASFNMGKTELEFVQFGLKGFDNFTKGEGKQVYFKTEPKVVNGQTYHVVANEIVKIIPGNVIKELADKIREVNDVNEEERKN